MAPDELLAGLPSLRGLIDRLNGLPPYLGEITLAALRDTSCLADLREAVTHSDPKERVEALFEVITRAGREPELTLAALGATELLLGPDFDLAPSLRDHARAERGRLRALTGEVEAGIDLLRQLGGTTATWYLLDIVRLVPQLSRRVKLLDDLLIGQPEDRSTRALHQAARIERWWVALASDARAAVSVRYEVENYLAGGLGEELAPDEGDTLRGRALHCLGHALSLASGSPLLDLACVRLREAIPLYRRVGDQAGLARGLDTLGRVLTRMGRHEEATAAFDEALALKQHLRDVWGLGATLDGMAQQRLAQGRPLEGAALLQANLVLLPLLEAPATLLKQKRGQLVLALLTAAFPLNGTGPDILPRLQTATMEYREPPETDNSVALTHFYNAARHWLEARQIPDSNTRRARLQPVIRLLQASLRDFKPTAQFDERPRIAIYLALALMDRAEVATEEESSTGFLKQASEVLRRADTWPVEQTVRPYLEWTFARWAGLTHRFDERQAHLASARYWAELTGNVQFQGVVDDSLSAQLGGPVRTCSTPLILRPSETFEVPLLVSDRRDRPLPRFELRLGVSGQTDRFHLEAGETRTDESGQARVVVHAGNQDAEGTLDVRTRAGRLLATIPLEVRHLRIDGWQASAEDEFVLRQLFGVGYQRLLIRRAFVGGLSGAQVLLVHPRMRPPDGSGPAWHAQPCIVKIGEAGPLASEWERYQRWVQDLLPANVTRVTRFVAWENRAALLMSLVGTGWSRSRNEHEWLLDASPFDAHYLLEQVFHRDLGLAWYANTSSEREAAPLLSAYAWALPPTWTLKDTNPPSGLLTEPPEHLPRLDLLTGLQTDPVRHTEGTVVLEGLEFHEARPVGLGWEYELLAPARGLRVCLWTPLRPEQVDSEGFGTRLREPGRTWCIQGRPVLSLAARLRRNLIACCGFWQRNSGGRPAPSYDPVAGTLRLPVGESMLVLPDPVAALRRQFTREAPWHGSVIHGDLHGQNILVNAQGQPYYIDFAKTRFGPTLYDFIKHEQYLWHDVFARLVDVDLGTIFAWMFPLLGRLRREHHHLHRSGEDSSPREFPDWLAAFEQALHTLRVLGRAYCRAPGEVDFHAPYAGLAAVMLRWCGFESTDPPAEQRIRARQGLLQAALSAWTLQHALAPAR